MLVPGEALALAAWLLAVTTVQLRAGGAAGPIATGLSALAALRPLTDALCGTAVGDDDAAIGAGLLWTIAGIVWLIALISFYVVALLQRQTAAGKYRNRG